MFKKVLIAEDWESINISVRKTLEDLGIPQDSRDYVFYCDDALMRIKKAIKEINPYELLITDLSFDEDTRPQEIASGVELIRMVKRIQPELKILVFSIDNRVDMANSLFEELDIDAYVPKARHDAKDMKSAIETIYQNKKYISPNLKSETSNEKHHVFTDFDKTIISLLSGGVLQKEIPLHLKSKQISPQSLSSIEKRINLIKVALNVSTNEQLIAYCKDHKIV